MASPREYQIVSCGNDQDIHALKCEVDQNDTWKPFCKQLMVASAYFIMYFTSGLCMGAPTVFIPQLRAEANSTEAVSAEMAIWISSVMGYAALPWAIFFPIMLHYFGRKTSFIFVCMCVIGTFICYLTSSTPTQILIAEILQGIQHASLLSVAIFISTEYSTPKYRGVFLTIKSATFNWGVWVSNAIGTYFHWKCIFVLGLICSLGALHVFIWPRSPYWLASKGRYEESKKAYKWLAGDNEKAETEAEAIVASQMQYLKRRNEVKNPNWKTSLSFLIKKEFYKPVLLSCLLLVFYQATGKQVVNMYAIDIIKDLTNNESAAYTGMLILDGVAVICMYLGCIITKYAKRRTLLLYSGFFTGLFLLSLSVHSYLIKALIWPENKYVSISLLVGFFIAVSLGPYILITCILAEMLPVNNKSVGVCIASLVYYPIQSVFLQCSPYIFKYGGAGTAFIFYGISVIICASILYKYLPETKDKTILEIEQFFKA